MFMLDRLFYQQCHFANACSHCKYDPIIFVAGRAWAVRIDSGSIYFFFIRLFGAIANKSQKGGIFGFMMVESDQYFG